MTKMVLPDGLKQTINNNYFFRIKWSWYILYKIVFYESDKSEFKEEREQAEQEAKEKELSEAVG